MTDDGAWNSYTDAERNRVDPHTIEEIDEFYASRKGSEERARVTRVSEGHWTVARVSSEGMTLGGLGRVEQRGEYFNSYRLEQLKGSQTSLDSALHGLLEGGAEQPQ